jgi:hypothetical protein
MLHRVALVRTDVSEELSASIIKLHSVCRLLFTANLLPSSPILVTLMVEVLISSETSVLTRGIRRNTPEDAILHSHHRENLKSYTYFESHKRTLFFFYKFGIPISDVIKAMHFLIAPFTFYIINILNLLLFILRKYRR